MVNQREAYESSFYDDIAEQDTVPSPGDPQEELGVTGLKRAGGYVDEEFLPALRTGRKAMQVYREMSLNDSMVGAMLFAITQLIKGVDFKVVPNDQSQEQLDAAEFLDSCKDDMSHSWGDFIAEVCSMLAYGYSWHEIVYKKRIGPWETDPSKRSKYDDGLFGWRKLPIRSQETLLRWVFDDTGGVKAMVQMAPPHYRTSVIPIEKSLLFRTDVSKGNPEGKSILRTAYRSWYLKKRLEEFEAIGVERDLAGMPVARVPAEYLNPHASPEKKAMVNSFRKMVRGVRRDENEGLIIPAAFDAETKQPLFDFELMSSGGSRQMDTSAIIQRYEQRILMTVLADFILVGHEQTGSYSLHTDKTGIFRAAINSIVDSIADVLNRHAVPRLFAVNGWRLNELPKFEPVDVDPPDLTQLSQFISSTSAAGMQWFPDPELEKFVREIARLPEMTEETLDFKREMLLQEQAMMGAESQMGLLGLKQKAEMTAQGFSPEQAEMASQTPTSEMVTAEQQAQLDADEELQGHPAMQRQKAEEQEQMVGQAQLQDEQKQADHERQKESGEIEHKRAKDLEAFKAKNTPKTKPKAPGKGPR